MDGGGAAAAITHGSVFRAINKAGRVWGDGMSPKVPWDVVRAAAARAGIDKLAPHDRRRTCVCAIWPAANSIRFSSRSVTCPSSRRSATGCKQRLRVAVNDHLGIEPDAA
jgi:hypothetical protein